MAVEMVGRDDLVAVFAPMSEFILIKVQQIAEAADDMTEAARVLTEMTTCTDRKGVRAC